MIQLNPDLINGCIEFAGALFIANNAWRVWKDKQYKGVSMISTFFFTGWGIWNTYYYKSLNQNLSWTAGLLLVVINAIWLGLMWKYRNSSNTAVQTPTKVGMTFDEICDVVDKIKD